MTAQLAPIPIQKFFDNNGNPLFNGKLYSYVAGTSTPQATYTDSTMGTQNTNPIILNARGEANVWLDTTLSYKLVLQEANGTQIWAVDNIPGNGVFGTVQNIAALRNVTGVGVSNYQAIIVDGYTTAGDGGGGTFWWNSTSTVADNGGTIIAPTGVSTGRWYRSYSGAPYVVWFGADKTGATDTTTNIQNALNFSNGGNYLIWDEGTYKVSSTLQVSSRIANIANGYVTLNFTGTGTNAVHVSSAYDGVVFTHCQGATFSNGFHFTTSDNTNSALYLGDSGTTYTLNDKRILENSSVLGFNNAIIIANECWGVSFTGCYFDTNINVISTLSSLTNSGERIVFIDCTFTGITGSVVENLSSSTFVDYYFTNCSFDYNHAIMDSNNVVCHVHIVGCHIEYSSALVSHFTVNAGSLRINQSVISPTVAVASFITMSGNAVIDVRENDYSSASAQSNAFCTMSGLNAGTFLYDRNDTLFNFYWPTAITGGTNGSPNAIVAINPSVTSSTTPVSGTIYQNTTAFTQIQYLQITFSPTTSANAALNVYIGPTSGSLTNIYINTVFSNTAPQSVGLGIPVMVPPGWYWKVTFTNCTAFSGIILNGM